MALRNRFTATVGVLALVAGLALAVPTAASATVSAGAPVVINEVYPGGANAGALYKQKYVELFNTGSTAADLTDMSLQYASSAGTNWSGMTTLSGSISAGGYFLVGLSSGTNGSDLPVTPDLAGSWAPSATNGNIALATGTAALSCSATACAADSRVLDLIGYGTGAAFVGSAASSPADNTKSLQRANDPFQNTPDNGLDYFSATPTPKAVNAADSGPVDVGEKTIAEIQGAGDASPFEGDIATTKGIVTATYPDGGFNGYVIQTPGTGGTLDFGAHQSSDAIFVFSSATVGDVSLGDYVQVKGTVSEFSGLTEMTVDAGNFTVLTESVAAVQPITNAWPTTDAQRESIESMLFAGSGSFTITNTYSTNQYAEIGLAYGSTPLMQPTDVARPGSQGALDVAADNAARGVVLDDGASINFLSGANSAIPLPYVSLTNPVRVGETVTFGKNVIVDYRNNWWKLQPTSQVTAGAPGDYPATWTDNRTAAPDAAALGSGDLQVASFNVLNYFTTLGMNVSGCTPYNDRDGNGITTKSCSGQNGPRGAWDAASLQRQQDKIVHAINALDADVIGLMEIENSLVVDGPGHEDAALSTLVDALNVNAGSTKWAFVPSSADLPPASEMDVINNAIIYQVASVDRLGTSHALGDQSGTGEPFVNAREPIAQAFTPKGGGTPFLLVVNHFKSKGSAGPLPGDADSGDGQGASNVSRVAQATALSAWIPTLQSQNGVGDVFMTGDYNSYTAEDPLKVLYDAGWTDLNDHYDTGKQSYSFGGMNGSLDHVLANASALARAIGADIWNINAPESIALEYSRYNYNVTNFYDTTAYRSSDHDPVVAGFNSKGSLAPTTVQILGINDFHGRISANGQEAGAAVLAGAVKELGEDYPGATVFAGAGDFIGASTFESFIAHDKPTIDTMNAAGLDVSSVGNHEFDQGYEDLMTRVIAPYDAVTNPYGGAEWKYLGANVKFKASGDPALEATWVKQMNGVKVGFIGVVTEHLPELVSPAGIANLDITDIADAVNTEADALKADGVGVVVMLVHEGSPNTSCDSVTDDSNDFGKIINALDENVDAVVSGHTHLTYNCMVDVPAWAGRPVTKRPVMQAGSYGYNLDQLLFTVTEGEITAIESNTIPLTSKDGSGTWVANYPSDPTVAATVADAVANASVLGAQPLGEIGGEFDRAKLSSASENRGGESTLGNLVAEAQRWATEGTTTGSAQIAFMNPGGLRADMVGSNADGYPAVLTYKQAATVQPFANTLVNMTLTGAQIKTVLEQQWQPQGSSRPFLRLGMSDGLTYTYDPVAAADSHITQMWLDGQPVDAGTNYSVTVNSFLASGGDNFFELANGTNRKDTGQTDLQGMVDYMAANDPAGSALSVDYTQRSVGVSYVGGADGYAGGDPVQFDLSSLAFSNAADLTDTQIMVSLNGTALGSFTVDNTIGPDPNDEYGTAHVSVTLPMGTPVGTAMFTVTGSNTGTTTRVPVGVDTLTFTDVAPTNPFVDDIAWLASTGITTGYPDGSFKPGAPVQRQAMAAFLYRYTHPGQADPTCTGPTRLFADVKSTNKFCGSIEWMKTAGITNGYNGGTEFRPMDAVQRQAMAAFLYRVQNPGVADLPCTGATRTFTDVIASNPFCGSIEWLSANGITNGDGVGTFKPSKSVERQSMAAFLHRLSAL